MPTPFTHLRLVSPLLESPDDWFSPAVVDLLTTHCGPFLLGNTAPDVRNISPVSRRDTHFYPIPPDPRRPSMQTMLQTWPSLADPAQLPPAQAAFVAGYLAHLWFDEFWHMSIVYPYYVEKDDWGTHRARFDVYNVLLGYLDVEDKAVLDASVGPALQTAEPAGWLPFVSDADLVAWRDFLAEQLRPGENSRTVAIMARRAHMDPVDFAALISDEERMEREVFIRTPRAAVEQAYTEGAAGSVGVANEYLRAL